MSQGWPLNDILVTPLYVCTNPAAVVPLDTSADLRLVGRAASDSASFDAAELDVLLRELPTCGALVYALGRQQQRARRGKVALPLSILDSSIWASALGNDFTEKVEALAADVYVSAVSPSLPSAPSSWTSSPASVTKSAASLTVPRVESADRVLSSHSEAWAATLSQQLLRRWARLPSQSVVCCGERQATLRQRKGLLLRHISDIQRDTGPAEATHSDPYAHKLSAALYLLDALRPACPASGRQACDSDEALSSVVVDALDMFLEECKDDNGHRQPPEGLRRYRLWRGRVRRLAAFAPAVGPLWATDEPWLIPEPNYLQLPWCTAHSAALALSAAQASAAYPSCTTHVPASSAASVPPPPHTHVALSRLDDCMRTLRFTPEQQTCLHELAYGVVYLASLKFVPRRGSGTGPAEVSPSSLPALSAAAQLLHLPTSALVTALTTMEARENGAPSSLSTQHALNCAGATQMQRVLVAHIGGLLVRSLLQLINTALDVDGHAGTAVRTLTLAATTDDEDTTAQIQCAHVPDKHCESREASGHGLVAWYAAYVRSHIAANARDRLIGALQREVCCEGVGLEVRSWLDQLSAVSTGPTAAALRVDVVAAEVREVSARVMMPSTKQAGRGAIVAAHAAASAYESVGIGSGIPVLAELALILEGVASRCIGVHASAMPPLSSLAEVQHALTKRIQALAASARQTRAVEAGNASAHSPEVVCTWEDAASADISAGDGALLLTFPGGLHPPLRLSVRRLASDIFAAARLCVMGTTRAMQRLLHGFCKWCMSVIPTVIADEDRGRRAVRVEPHQRQHVGGGRERDGPMNGPSLICPCSVHEALRCTLALHRSNRSSIADREVDASHRGSPAITPTTDFLYVMLAIPVPREPARWETLLDIGEADHRQHLRGSPSVHLFLERVPPHEAPVSSSPAGQVAVTRDDVLAAYLRERQPLLVALFLWSRLCHCHLCPVSVFAKACAVPLLTSYARWPPSARVPPRSVATSSLAAEESREDGVGDGALLSVTDVTSRGLAGRSWLRAHPVAPDEAAAKLLKRVRQLQSQGRYRELCLLAVERVPQCGDGGAVLGVSVVFIGASTVAAIQSCCRELHDASARSIQEAGRGFAARRCLCFARQQQLQQRQQQRHQTAHSADNRLVSAAASSTEMRRREDLERVRDALLTKTAHRRTNVLINAARHLSHAVSLLQQRWTETLELLEGELTGAVREINVHEEQRQAAEDVARQEARMSWRVREEAWSEVWSPLKSCEGHRQAAQAVQRRGCTPPLALPEVESTAATGEGAQQANDTARHAVQLRHAAAHSAEAAGLSRLIRASLLGEAKVLAGHIRRQEVCMTRMADNLQRDCGGGGGAVREERSRRGRRRGNGVLETPARRAESPAEFSRRERRNPEGLMLTRPRHSPCRGRAVAGSSPAPGEQHTPSMLGLRSERDRLGVSARTAIETIKRTRAAMTLEDSSEWAVQRDLMALWESSRMSV
ncbi:hypothetical protein LSCM1_05245 [Leishmania martiniquensis]|uniref:Uncharacterized protein n=1 Tax=Leishmania martiniquensis TaxID=1580590 RepID=A0A836GZZ1_9TRYP|nr:hypothetical protein LSCM1_05245 [Leishmania martiniquensis]